MGEIRPELRSYSLFCQLGLRAGANTLSDRQKGSDARQKGSDAGQYGPVIGQCKVFTTLENYDATLIKLSDWSMQRRFWPAAKKLRRCGQIFDVPGQRFCGRRPRRVGDLSEEVRHPLQGGPSATAVPSI